jgi:hypothetical protein
MADSSGLSARLPAPRDDEPPGLRQDIIDELADHLACSTQRELLRGADPATARARVLERFGDPAAVARRLWLDAMRGRIMAQRVVIGTCVILTAVSLGLAGLLFQMTIDARRMAALQAAEAEARAAEARVREQEMLKRLGEMSEAIKHPRSPDWNPVRMKLTEETPDGPPVAGASIVLTRLFENPPKTIQKQSDARGLADFGSIQPGDYTFEIARNAKDWSLETNGELNVQPGSDVTKLIVCPKVPPPRVGVRVRWQWPSDLEKEPLVLYLPFNLRSRELASGILWQIRRPNPDDSSVFRTFDLANSLLCGPSSDVFHFKNNSGPLLWTIMGGNVASVIEAAAKLGPGDFADVVEADLEKAKPGLAALDFEIGTYGLSELIVLRPRQARVVSPGRREFDLLVAVRAPHYIRRIHVALEPPSKKDFLRTRSPMITGATDGRGRGASYTDFTDSTPTIELPKEFWRRVDRAYEASPGKSNEWTIPLPGELIQAVRQALKAEQSRPDGPTANTEAGKSK